MADLLDTSALIGSWHFYYRPAAFPGVWEWFEHALNDGRIILIPQVRAELTPSDDEFETWIATRAVVSEPTESQPLARAYEVVEEQLTAMRIEPVSLERFMKGADFHLIAHAAAGKHRIVTLERPESPDKQRPRAKIPDVCDALGIAHSSPFRLFEDHGARFDLRR